jgi:hypothetical protein
VEFLEHLSDYQLLKNTTLIPSVSCIKIYRIIILPVAVCGCETWFLELRKEHRLRVLDNRVLRIFGPNREEAAGGWKRLHNEELH